MYRGAQICIHARYKFAVIHFCRCGNPLQHLTHHRITLLGTAHRFDHIAKKGRVQVTKKTDVTAIVMLGQKYAHLIGLGRSAFRLNRISLFIASLKIAAIECVFVGKFARQHCIRLRTCGHQNSVCGQTDFACFLPFTVGIQHLVHQYHGAGITIARAITIRIHLHAQWR